MNFSDLFIVVAAASALYGLIAAVMGRGRFLVKAVNPHRTTWLITGASTLWVGISLLRLEAQAWDLAAWASLLSQLVTDTPTPARVKVASMGVFLGILFLTLVVWCYFVLPRDPSTFHRPEDRKAAFKYYVGKLRRGLDYAVLACGDGERLCEEVNTKQVHGYCQHLPKILLGPEEQPRLRNLDDQLSFWRDMAATIHNRMPELDKLIEPARHGRNRRLVFDAEYGGFFFKYLRLPDPSNIADRGLYLFGATLNQIAMDSSNAENHFQLLLEALQHIERGIRMA